MKVWPLRERFWWLWEVLMDSAFKTAALNHSAISPRGDPSLRQRSMSRRITSELHASYQRLSKIVSGFTCGCPCWLALAVQSSLDSAFYLKSHRDFEAQCENGERSTFFVIPAEPSPAGNAGWSPASAHRRELKVILPGVPEEHMIVGRRLIAGIRAI